MTPTTKPKEGTRAATSAGLGRCRDDYQEVLDRLTVEMLRPVPLYADPDKSLRSADLGCEAVAG
jgi:hypothetical protein